MRLGYERDFTVNLVVATLPKAKELGLGWAGLDDGWQRAVGDWQPDPKKFPRGDADMLALVKAIKDAGLKPKLWIAPLAAHPASDLIRDHADLLLLDKDGAVQNVTWWDSYYLCPAYPETVEQGKALVRKVIGEWGYAGLKLDGQHLGGVALPQSGAQARAARGVGRKAAGLLEGDLRGGDCDRSGRRGRTLPVRHGASLSQHAVHEPAGRLRSRSSWQVRHKGKTIKALMGPSAAYAGDHVELSDKANDFASTVGIGGIVSTRYTWPRDPSRRTASC